MRTSCVEDAQLWWIEVPHRGPVTITWYRDRAQWENAMTAAAEKGDLWSWTSDSHDENGVCTECGSDDGCEHEVFDVEGWAAHDLRASYLVDLHGLWELTVGAVRSSAIVSGLAEREYRRVVPQGV